MTDSPDWDINIYYAPAYGINAHADLWRIAVYDRATSSSDPVISGPIFLDGDIDGDDDWFSPDSIDVEAAGLAHADRERIATFVERAKAAHPAWLAARKNGAAEPARQAAGEQSRITRGVPAGGQFASRDRAEGDVEL